MAPDPSASDALAIDPKQQAALLDGRCADPFGILGIHGHRLVVRVPEAVRVHAGRADSPLQRIGESDLFAGIGDWQAPVRVRWVDAAGQTHEHLDAYAHLPPAGDQDLHYFAEGTHRYLQRFLGANPAVIDGVNGIVFRVWAPNARGVSVVGDFNGWDGRWHAMRLLGPGGVWGLFIPDAAGQYKYELRTASGTLALKSDPMARRFEAAHERAAVIVPQSTYAWQDSRWMAARDPGAWQHRPMSIYEVHLGSWRRATDGRLLSCREVADQLVPWVADLGFTHIELLPVTEHPFYGSWGYQSTGYFAVSERYGTPDDLRYLVDCCHRRGIGVLLDWTPAHFPDDAHAMERFDGTALYEHEDPRLGRHPDWGTLIFNYGRREVMSFLLSSAVHWLTEFHFDGLRVDAVASMLYLDYSRRDGEWLPNRFGGRENLEAIDFLRELNRVCHGEAPGALVIAEESTAWPAVTRPGYTGGLGFAMKWNMGWMNDTLEYFGHDPIHRRYHHERLTFGLIYAFSENFVLPLSHDEVVHGKGSLIARMPGDRWQQFANLRLLFTLQFTYPGKKLLFMGCEFAQAIEWNHDAELDWKLLDEPEHRGVLALVRDLNKLYTSRTALHCEDFVDSGFEWIDCNDNEQSVISFVRRCADGQFVIVVLNFTPVPRPGYRIGVPEGGVYRELLNSDSGYYGGSNVGTGGSAVATQARWMGRDWSIVLDVPPLGGLVLAPAP